MPRATSKHPRSPVATGSDDSDTTPDMPFEEGAHDALDPDLRHRMISEAAYHLHVQRGYEDGYDLDDWFQAEAQVDHVIMNPTRSQATDDSSAEGALQ
jgi:hypothetical protein